MAVLDDYQTLSEVSPLPLFGAATRDHVIIDDPELKPRNSPIGSKRLTVVHLLGCR